MDNKEDILNAQKQINGMINDYIPKLEQYKKVLDSFTESFIPIKSKKIIINDMIVTASLTKGNMIRLECKQGEAEKLYELFKTSE